MNPTTEDQHAAQQQGEPGAPSVAAPGLTPAGAAPRTAPDSPARVPERPAPTTARRRRGRFIALLVIGGVVLLGAGFGIGYAVGNATATPTMGQFDPSQLGGPGGNGGGFGGPGGQGGPGSDSGTGTDSSTGDGTSEGTAS